VSLPSWTTSSPAADAADARQRRLEELFAQYGGAVYGFARRRTSAADAEEVVSDTFLVAWRRLDAVPPEPLPWLLTVARHNLANRTRGEVRQAALRARLANVADRYETDPGAAGASDVLTERIARALASLSPAEYDALTLLAWEGLTPDEAATVLGCSRAAVYLRLARARRRFRRAIDTGADPEGPRDDDD
jgi:RNA polymerase sigma-70 factor (ECF subfamily)